MTYIQKKKKTQRGTIWRHVTAILIAGSLSKTALAPIERVKLILQVNPLLNNEQIQSARQAFHSFGAFWRGNGVNVYRILPNVVFRFSVYDKFKQYIIPNTVEKTDQHFLGRLSAGTATGILSMLFNYPLDVVRVRLTSDMSNFNAPKQYSGIFDCIKKMVMQEGINSFYKGYLVANLGIAPYLGLSFAFYDTLMTLNLDNHQFIQMVGIGTLSGMIASLVTFPLDTLRFLIRRMQTNGIFGQARAYTGLKDCVQKTLKNEGIKGFYRGCGINLIKIIPALKIQFTIYDYLKESIFDF